MTSFADEQRQHNHHYLSYNTKKALAKGIIVGGIISVIYLVVVIATTPSLSPMAAINAAFAINSTIIIGTSVGVGAQIFIASYSKSIGCQFDDNKKDKKKKNRKGIIGAAAAGSGTTTAISSFFSFFSLVPLGCCGSWLLILSLLPSVFGRSLSVALIQFSKPVSYIGLAIVVGFTGLSAFKLQIELKQMKK